MKFRALKLYSVLALISSSSTRELPTLLMPLKTTICCTSFLIHEILTVIRTWEREAITAAAVPFFLIDRGRNSKNNKLFKENLSVS